MDSTLGYVSTFLNKADGSGTFGAPTSLYDGGNLTGIAVGDFNGDGIADLAYCDGTDILINWLTGTGTGTFRYFGGESLNGASPVQAAVADFNGDGLPDTLTGNEGNISLVLNISTWSASATVTHISPVGSGTHKVDAVYGATTSSTVSLTAKPVATTIRLAASPSTSQPGQQVALTATLSPYTAQNHGTDGETVSFYSGSTLLGAAPLATGQALLNVTSLPVGSDSLTAKFTADTNFAAATSTAVPFTVTPIPITLIGANLTDYAGNPQTFVVAQLLGSYTVSGYTVDQLEALLTNAEFGVTASVGGFSQNYPIYSYGSFVGLTPLRAVSAGTPNETLTLTPYISGPGAAQFTVTAVPGSVKIVSAP